MVETLSRQMLCCWVRWGNGCVDPECKSTILKDLTTVSSASDYGVQELVILE